MTKFNPDNKVELTYSETLEPAMKITEQEDADQYMNDYMTFLEKMMESAPEEEKAKMSVEEIAKGNLGYWAGYHDDETRARVEKLFKCKHPVFGSIEEKGPISATQAFELGQAMAAQMSIEEETK